MDTLVDYPPQNPGEYSYIDDRWLWGIIPIRLVVNRRFDGWCVYVLPTYMHCNSSFDITSGWPTSFETVRDHGKKIPSDVALRLFPEMDQIPYVR